MNKYSQIASILIDVSQEERYDEDILNCIDNFIKELNENPDFIIRSLEEFKENYTLENDVCPICYGSIITKEEYDNELIEYNGFPERQDIYVGQCFNCGNII